MLKYRTIVVSVLATLLLAQSMASLAWTAEAPSPPRVTWSFSGPFGKYDQGQLQRGFKIYKEVCASCHSLGLLAFRTLAEPGGPGFSMAHVAALASEHGIKDINDAGEPIERAGRPADHFPPPFPNTLAAQAANGGVAPPDMSTLAKARSHARGFPWFLFDIFTQYQEQGPDYIAALLTGYDDAPSGFKVPPGGFYNAYVPGHVTAMPPPLQDGMVSFDDDAPRNLRQYSKDVAAFLMWAAEPHLVARKRIGLQVTLFLIVLTGLLYLVKKKVWSTTPNPPDEPIASVESDGSISTHRPTSHLIRPFAVRPPLASSLDREENGQAEQGKTPMPWIHPNYHVIALALARTIALRTEGLPGALYIGMGDRFDDDRRLVCERQCPAVCRPRPLAQGAGPPAPLASTRMA